MVYWTAFEFYLRWRRYGFHFVYLLVGLLIYLLTRLFKKLWVDFHETWPINLSVRFYDWSKSEYESSINITTAFLTWLSGQIGSRFRDARSLFSFPKLWDSSHFPTNLHRGPWMSYANIFFCFKYLYCVVVVDKNDLGRVMFDRCLRRMVFSHP